MGVDISSLANKCMQPTLQYLDSGCRSKVKIMRLWA